MDSLTDIAAITTTPATASITASTATTDAIVARVVAIAATVITAATGTYVIHVTTTHGFICLDILLMLIASEVQRGVGSGTEGLV